MTETQAPARPSKAALAIANRLRDAARNETFDFEEDKHPRDSHGRFDPGGGGGGDSRNGDRIEAVHYQSDVKQAAATFDSARELLAKNADSMSKPQVNAAQSGLRSLHAAQVALQPPGVDAHEAAKQLVGAASNFRKAGPQFEAVASAAHDHGAAIEADRKKRAQTSNQTPCTDCGGGLVAAGGDTSGQSIGIDPQNPGRFRAILAVEDERTADNRIIAPGATKWRTPPLPLMLMTKTADGHDGSEIAGVIENIVREGANIIGEGRFDTGESGLEAARLVANQVLTGVSIDAGDVEGEIEVEDADADGNALSVLAKMTALTILGATVVPFPAIGSTSISYLEPLANDDESRPEGTLDFETLAAEGVTYSVSAGKNLPFADRDTAWDAGAADDRVRAWAGASDAPNAKYGQAFFWKDGDGTNFGDFHLGFADVINGKLTAVPHGVFAAAAAVQGSRGASLPYANAVKGVIGTYYTKMAKVFDDPSITTPWAVAEVITAAGPIIYPNEMFADPEFAVPTPIRVDAEGHVSGHAAVWGKCHIGFPGTCTTAPKSRTNYSHFLTGSLPLEEGGFQPVGTITLDTSHAEHRMSAREAAMHYDHTGTAAAFVNVGEDAHGIWVSGVLRPGLADEDATILSASSLSGDWRRIGGNLELVALLSVNTPGFPVAYTAGDEQVALVAAGYGHIKPKQSHSQLAAEIGHAAETALARTTAHEIRLASMQDEIDVLRKLVAPMARERLAERLRGPEPDEIVASAEVEEADAGVAEAEPTADEAA